jgi:hypothetical protein
VRHTCNPDDSGQMHRPAVDLISGPKTFEASFTITSPAAQQPDLIDMNTQFRAPEANQDC